LALLRSRQKPRFLQAETQPMSEKRPQAVFLVDQQGRLSERSFFVAVHAGAALHCLRCARNIRRRRE
jgi:hypothetical protein